MVVYMLAMYTIIKFVRRLTCFSKQGIVTARQVASAASTVEDDLKVEKIDSGVVIRLGDGEKRLIPSYVRALNRALDVAESFEDVKYLVTIGDGKHYSLGLDLDLYSTMNMHDNLMALGDVQKLLARLITFPLITVSAINGHAFGAGFFPLLAHDYRVMRADKGWLCLPEINIKALFTAGFMEFIKATIPQLEHRRAILFGTRYTAEEAKAVGIINEVSPMEQLESHAIAAGNRLAGKDGLDRKILAAIKHDLYRDVYRVLMDPAKYYTQQ